MMRTPVIAGVILFLAASSASAQQIYRWTDEKGRVHITDTPPPPSAKDVQRKSYGSGPARAGQESYELKQAMENFPVTLYTAPSCDAPCADARAALNRRGVPFKEVPVTDAQTADELKRISGGEQVPVLLVGRSVHTGFLQSAYDALLDSARYPKTGSVPPRSQAAPSEGRDERAAEPQGGRESQPTGPYAPGAPRQGSSAR